MATSGRPPISTATPPSNSLTPVRQRIGLYSQNLSGGDRRGRSTRAISAIEAREGLAPHVDDRLSTKTVADLAAALMHKSALSLSHPLHAAGIA